MIAVLIGIITSVLALFLFWRARSAAFRRRCEEPKFRFLENLGIAPKQEDDANPPTHPQGGPQ